MYAVFFLSCFITLWAFFSADTLPPLKFVDRSIIWKDKSGLEVPTAQFKDPQYCLRLVISV